MCIVSVLQFVFHIFPLTWECCTVYRGCIGGHVTATMYIPVFDELNSVPRSAGGGEGCQGGVGEGQRGRER